MAKLTGYLLKFFFFFCLLLQVYLSHICFSCSLVRSALHLRLAHKTGVFSPKYYWNSEVLKSTAFCFGAKLIFHSLFSQVLSPTVSPTPTYLLLHNPMPSTFPPSSPFAFQLISTCAEAASSICSVLPPQPLLPAITAPISLRSTTSPGEHIPTHLQRIIDSK